MTVSLERQLEDILKGAAVKSQYKSHKMCIMINVII